MRRALDILFPLLLAATVLAAWEAIVDVKQIPPYILPAPSAIFAALVQNWSSLSASMLVTISVTLQGFLGALIAAIALAILFSQSRLAERAL